MRKSNLPKAHFVPNYFLNLTHRVTIGLIGCGGTGSLIVPRLARLDFALKELGLPGIHLTIYDGDKVEQKNVGRQGFIPSDIGQYKASCMVERMNFGFGLQWSAENSYLENPIIEHNIIITAVDNVDIRNKMHVLLKNPNAKRSQRIDYNHCYYWLDCGNGKDFGQVFLSTAHSINQPKTKLFETVSELQTVIDFFGDLEKFDNKETQGIEGCSYAESLTEQDLFINDKIAVVACEMISKLLRYPAISYNGVFVNLNNFTTKPLKL